MEIHENSDADVRLLREIDTPVPKSIRIGLFAKFMFAGIPAFALAVPSNWLLVEQFACPKPVAYGLVLILQMTVNFLICRRYVFPKSGFDTVGRQYISFMGGNTVIRSFDWAVYSALVAVAPKWYLAFQGLNLALFALVKFTFARFIFARCRDRP